MPEENKCPHHGELEEKVSGVKEDVEELKKLQKEDNKELKDGQKEILNKIDKFLEVRLADFKACSKNQEALKTYVDTKVATVSNRVKTNALGLVENNAKTQKVYNYVGAAMAIFAITVTIIKLI